jgi:hypothetical protein
VPARAAVVCILLASPRMVATRTSTIARTDRTSLQKGRRVAGVRLIVSALTAAVLVTPAQAQVAQGDGVPPHVRPEPEMRALVADAARGSLAIRGLIDHLEGLDVTVYVRQRAFAQTELEGRVALLAATGVHRYLVIELACGRPRLTQMATLGHELHHAMEIADEPSVVNAQTLAAFYTRIGRRSDYWGGRMMFETEAAAEAGLRVRRELLTNSTRLNTTRRSNGS